MYQRSLFFISSYHYVPKDNAIGLLSCVRVYIISYTQYVGIVIAIFGSILMVKGINISSGKRRYTWGTYAREL